MPVVSVYAEAPNLLTYQGRLKESGQPFTGNKDITIWLCPGPTDSGCFSSPSQTAYVSNGLFRSTFTVPSGVNLSTGEWYLKIQVGAVVLTPFEKLTSSVYSLYATTAAYANNLAASPGAPGIFVSTNFFVAAGNVGIGTTSPQYSFSVQGTMNIDQANANSGGLDITFGPAGSWEGIGSKRTAGGNQYGLDFYTGITNRMSITNGGNIGIGTTGPLSKFDVLDGSITVRGTNAGLTLQDANRVVSPETNAALGAGIRISTNVYIVGFSSAAKYYGDGSALTGVTMTGGVLKTGDTMTGPLTIAGSTLTVTGNAFSVGGSTLAVRSGKVSIGTTANPDSRTLLVFGRDADFSQGAGLGLRLQTDSVGVASAIEFLGDGGMNSQVGGYQVNSLNSGIFFNTRDSGAVGEKVRITNSGSVGIGTTSPGYKLDVDGDMNLAAGGNYRIGGVIQSVTSKWTAGADNDIYRSLGNVGIGTTAPGSKFEVVGGSSTFRGNDNNSAIAGFTDAGGNYRVVISTAGNVGIGTTGPSAKLHVLSSESANTVRLSKDTGGGNVIDIYNGGSNGSTSLNIDHSPGNSTALIVNHNSTGNIADFRYTGTSVLIVKDGGNVGIGTTNPLAKLDVAGVIRSSSSIYPGDGGNFQSDRYIKDDAGKYGTVFSSNVYIVGFSSAAKYYGDGAGLTNLPAPANVVTTDTSQVISGTKTFTGQLVLNSTLTVIAPTNAASSLWVSTSITMPHLYVSTTGNVGIGTTAIPSKLTLGSGQLTVPNGSNSFPPITNINSQNTGIFFPNDNSVGFTTGLNERMRITNTGTVGIGTTAPTAKLDVNGTDVLLNVRNGGVSYFFVNPISGNVGIGTTAPAYNLHVVFPNGGIRLDKSGGNADTRNWLLAVSIVQEGDFSIHQSMTQGGDPWTAGISRLYIANTGNVGIGTTNPSYKLDISSGVTTYARIGTTGASADATLIYNNNLGGGWLVGNNGAGTNEYMISTVGSQLNTNPKVTIQQGGNVGIGTTNPAERLQVAGGNILLDNNQAVLFRDSGGTARSVLQLSNINDLYLRNPATGGRLYFVTGVTPALQMTITADGSVGIGTTSPGAKLHVSGGDVNTASFKVEGSSYVILNAGNVGIGTTAPGAKLDVAGDIRISAVGSGLRVMEGINARMGTAVLVAGTVTVPNTSVTATSRIFLTAQTPGGTLGTLYVSARTAATSFTITSTNAADISTVAWLLVEP